MELEVEEKLFIIDFLKFIDNIIEKGSIITLLRKGIGPGDLHCFGPALRWKKIKRYSQWKGGNTVFLCRWNGCLHRKSNDIFNLLLINWMYYSSIACCNKRKVEKYLDIHV